MRLHADTVNKIIEEGIVGEINEYELRKYLLSLDLRFDYRDSSQSVLVKADTEKRT